MSTNEKSILDWSECDPDLLSNFIEKLTLEPIPDISNSLDVLEDVTNVNQNLDDQQVPTEDQLLHENGKDSDDKLYLPKKESTFVDQKLSTKDQLLNENGEDWDDKLYLPKGESTFVDQKLSTKDQLLNENGEDSDNKLYFPKGESTFVSIKGKKSVISVEKGTNSEVFNILNSEVSSDSSSDTESDDSDSLLARGKEKTKKKSCSRKQYERPARKTNASEFNQQSLQFLSFGYIVQNNVVDNLQSSQAQFGNSYSSFPLNPVQSVDSANYNDCSINSPFNVSSPESGYDTQSSEVFSPSPPNVQAVLNRNIIEEEKELQFITDGILELEESLKKIEAQQSEVNIPGLDEFGYNDYIEQLKLFFKESDDGIVSNGIDSELCSNLTDKESSKNEIGDFIPLENLLDDFETESNSQSISSDTSVSELEYNQPVSNTQKSVYASCCSSTKTTKIDYKLKDIAKHQLRFSESFDNENYLTEIRKVLVNIRGKKQCIEVEQQTENSKRTNSEDYDFQKKMRFQK